MKRVLWILVTGLSSLCLSGYSADLAVAEPVPGPPWESLRSVSMTGGLKVFWNVGTRDPENATQPAAHGFLSVDLLNSYSDYTP